VSALFDLVRGMLIMSGVTHLWHVPCASILSLSLALVLKTVGVTTGWGLLPWARLALSR
jgi:hypothetical protein